MNELILQFFTGVGLGMAVLAVGYICVVLYLCIKSLGGKK